MKIRFAGLFLLASLFLLSACGQKGPLYLKNEPVAATSPVESEKDDELNKTEENAEKAVAPETKD